MPPAVQRESVKASAARWKTQRRSVCTTCVLDTITAQGVSQGQSTAHHCSGDVEAKPGHYEGRGAGQAGGGCW